MSPNIVVVLVRVVVELVDVAVVVDVPLVVVLVTFASSVVFEALAVSQWQLWRSAWTCGKTSKSTDLCSLGTIFYHLFCRGCHRGRLGTKVQTSKTFRVPPINP